MSRIFVSIASYRDPELIPTLEDLIKNCSNLSDLTICIGWQYSEEDTWENLDAYKHNPVFKIIDIPYSESKGVCWVRSKIQEQYNGEDYYLQLDSHHRFIKNWDIHLIDMLQSLQDRGYQKPLISSYAPGYYPEKEPEGRLNEVWGMRVRHFLDSGVPFLEPFGLENWRLLKYPVPSRFVSAHFLFTIGKFIKEVPYDEHLYFHGEESSLAARAYTWGYSLFHPHRPIVWHEYVRDGKKRHWDDNSGWGQLDIESQERYRKLMDMDEGCTPCQRNLIAPNYFGSSKSFNDYEKYAGIIFREKMLSNQNKDNDPPSELEEQDYTQPIEQTYTIKLNKSDLNGGDYEFLVVALVDKKGADIHRKDIPKEELQILMKQKNKQITIKREFSHFKKPSYWKIWPFSKSEGWAKLIQKPVENV